jgi:hypothetical protein
MIADSLSKVKSSRCLKLNNGEIGQFSSVFMSCIEWKNGEMKRFHGMSRARGSGLKALSVQIKLTAIAVNLKRIAAIMNEKAANSAPDSSIVNRFFSIIERSFKAFRISMQIGRQNTGFLMPAV